MTAAGRHREPLPQLRPAWDGIFGWIFMLLALLGAVLAWDQRVNGLDVTVFALAGLGAALMARRALR